MLECGIGAFLISFTSASACGGVTDALLVGAMPCLVILILRTFMWKGDIVNVAKCVLAALSLGGAVLSFLSLSSLISDVSFLPRAVLYVAAALLILVLTASGGAIGYGEVIFLPLLIVLAFSIFKNGMINDIGDITPMPLSCIGSVLLLFNQYIKGGGAPSSGALATLMLGCFFGAAFALVNTAVGALSYIIIFSALAAGDVMMISVSLLAFATSFGKKKKA